MQTYQMRWTANGGWSGGTMPFPDANLVLVFADSEHFREPACYHELCALFPHAEIVGCSSSGSVLETTISDNDIVATAIRLDRGSIKVATADIGKGGDAVAAARDLMRELCSESVQHVFVLSDGLSVNGSQLASG